MSYIIEYGIESSTLAVTVSMVPLRVLGVSNVSGSKQNLARVRLFTLFF